MKTTLAALLTLALFASAFSSCGELPPDRAAALERRRLEDEARERRNVEVVVSSLVYSSQGQVNLEYTATYNRDTQLFTFLVTRANQSNVNQSVTLSSADQPALFSRLLRVFTGELQFQGSDVCLSCRSDIEVRLNRAGSAAFVRYRFPTLRASTGSENLLDDLGTFILNRLRPQ